MVSTWISTAARWSSVLARNCTNLIARAIVSVILETSSAMQETRPMPRRVVAKWGWTGMVRLEGYARLDDPVGELDSHAQPAGDQRQALHRPLTGAQCDDLIKDLDLPLLDGHRTECHDGLNWIREDLLR